MSRLARPTSGSGLNERRQGVLTTNFEQATAGRLPTRNCSLP